MHTHTDTHTHLLLKSKYVSNAAVDRISKPGLSLVAYGDDSVEALVDRDVKKKLGDIAGSEDLVHRSKMSSALLRVEVGCKYATQHALPPQKLARATWASSSSSAAATTSSAASPGATRVCCIHYDDDLDFEVLMVI